METGIYKIVCLKNNKSYVGQTHDFKKRVRTHKTSLRRNAHHNKHLQNDFNVYGEEYFKYVFIEHCESDEELDIREDYWITELDSIKSGYNLKTGGIKHNKLSEETRKDLSKALKGRIISENQKKIISEKLKNRIVSEESINKLRKTFKERKVSVGSNNPAHILNESDVLKIKLALASGIYPMELSEIFKVSRNTIYEIKRCGIWKEVAEELNNQIKYGDKKAYKEKCNKALEMYKNGFTQDKIAKELKISRNTINKLLKSNV